MEPSRPIRDLYAILTELDGKPYQSYRQLLHQSFYHDRYLIRFTHVQGSPGAFPASVCHLMVRKHELRLPERSLSTIPRKRATADYVLRAFSSGVDTHACQNRGVQGSGSFQPPVLPPQVLERNLVRFTHHQVSIAFHISLPGSHENRVLGEAAIPMFDAELAGIVDTLITSIAPGARLENHCQVVEDMLTLQRMLERLGLVAFVGDGAFLPRQSGVSQAPLDQGAVAFHAPEAMAVEVDLPNAGPARGLGIRPGVNAVIGAAFHGKSTLLQALAMGIYPHIPGDGRERVVTHPDAMVICAEEGRAVNGLDISGFVHNLPDGSDAHKFQTQNASGSTSEAAAVIEAVLAGAKLLIIDEDASAANFLIKDHHMRRLLPEDTVTPLFDRVRELYQQWGVSTLMAIGGNSAHLGAAHHVLAMRNYRPCCMSDQVKQLGLPEPDQPDLPLKMEDMRRILADNFDPAYTSSRLGKTIAVRIKPLRLQEKILEYGNQMLDLTALPALVDPHQMAAIGYALLLAREYIKEASLSPSELARLLSKRIEKEGLDILMPAQSGFLPLAHTRRLELAAGINRLRHLNIDIEES